MKKKMFLTGRILPALMSAGLIMGSVPVSAQELTSGEETVWENDTAELPDALLEGQEEELLTAPEEKEDVLTGESQDEDGGEKQEGVRYIKDRPLTEEEREAQLAPMENLKEIPKGPDVNSNLHVSPGAGKTTPLPAKYDAREEGIITSVKNQMPYGACWAFAMASVMETALLRQGAGVFDLSEEHLCYFWANRADDPLGNTANDHNYHNMYNWTGVEDYHEGGNDMLAAEFLSTWSGMATEQEFPLLTNGDRTEFVYQNHDPSGAYKTSAYLEDSAFSEYSVERMKQLLMQYKSVSIMYNAVDNYYNPDTAAYSCPQAGAVNHVVTVIGWDDSFAKDNFNKASNTASDGAWIVKNSWGEDWGDNGYFYLSYEDKSISTLVCANAKAAPSYPNNYFYDGAAGGLSVGLTTGASLACVFETKAGGDRQEILGEIVAHTWSDDAIYSVQVYKNLKDKNNPVSGTPAYEEPVIYRQPIQGIDTISVPEVTLEPGSHYSVVITNRGKNILNYGVEAAADYGWCSFDPEIKPGQGFVQEDGQWTDLYSEAGTPRIKAHTRNGNVAVKAPKAPEAVKAEVKDYNKIQISWDPVPGCDGYTIYRQEGKNAVRGRASVVGDTSCTYLDKDVKSSSSYIKPGITYTYTVRAYVTADGKRKFSTHSPSASAVTRMETTSTAVRTNNNMYNSLSWNKIKGAEGYYVYRRIPGKAWECIKILKSANSLKYEDRKVKPLETYQYMVRAYRTIKGKEWYSPYKCSGKVVTAPALQKLSSVKAEKEGIKLTWKPQKKCSGYRIYRIDQKGVKKRLTDIKKGSASSYTDKTAKKGQKYTYYVQAFAKEFYGTVYSKYEKRSAVRK